MSRLDIKVQVALLKEADAYFKELKEEKQDKIVLTQEHIEEWLQVFYDDRIRMDTCNQASVKM